MVVVAIIGILAAVGTVTYSGYTSAAKANTTKANFKIMEKYMQNELAKCGLDDQAVIMKKRDGSGLNCSGITYGLIIPHLQVVFNTEKEYKKSQENSKVSTSPENETENINLRDYQNKEYNCASVNPHNGHGSTQGCNSTLTCSITFSFATSFT